MTEVCARFFIYLGGRFAVGLNTILFKQHISNNNLKKRHTEIQQTEHSLLFVGKEKATTQGYVIRTTVNKHNLLLV